MSKKQSITVPKALSGHKRSQFEKLANEAKTLENEINNLLASFEKRNNLVCYPLPSKRNSIELVISADINAL